MSDEQVYPTRDRRIEILVEQFNQLSPEDQDLVLTLVARLRGIIEEEYPSDVSFMDFDQ